MKRYAGLAALACVTAIGFAGCHNTAEGAGQDAVTDTHKLAAATQRAVNDSGKMSQNAAADLKADAKNAGADIKGDARNLSAATTLTPKVKLAIVSDKQLNDSRNAINVDSASSVVHLKGHVYNEAMKERAGQIAKRTLNQAHATDTLSNELTVTTK